MTTLFDELRYRDAVRRLHSIEGFRCYWRIAVGVLAGGAVVAIVLSLATLTVLLGADARSPVRVIAAAGTGLLTPIVGSLMWRRAPWWYSVDRRLDSYETIERGDRGVSILLPRHLSGRAASSLRRARLNPTAVRRVRTPPDAPELDCELTVFEPARHRRREVNQLAEFVSDTLAHAGVPCRVAASGVAIAPGAAWGLASPDEKGTFSAAA